MIVIREYIDEVGRSPYGVWFNALDAHAAAKVTVALERMAQGHASAMKALGEGISEYRIDFGPGYRIYFAKDGERLILLLGGGTKKRQQQDIAAAIAIWRDYKRRKKKKEQ